MAGRGRPADLREIQYFNENKTKILEDFERLGREETLKTWGISLWRWRVLQLKWRQSEDGMNHRDNGNNVANLHNGHTANGKGKGHHVAVPQAGHEPARIPHDLLASLLRKMADVEGSTELARGLRLAATLVEGA